ncbi:MAG: Ubiquitin family protein, partial [Microgenomates group bacterium Gr01-1014_80]
VEAYPDGTLIYQNRFYKELFYETDVNKINPPKNGLVLDINNLDRQLPEIITELGLSETEGNEFLDFWLPGLKNLDSPYLLFSVLDQAEKDRTDKIEISPEPDTFISFIAYFKPLNAPISIPPLLIPERPKRVGFTAVEWGGVIDR